MIMRVSKAKNNHLVGVVTDRDIAIRAIGAGKSPNTPVREVLSRQVLYCFEHQDINAYWENASFHNYADYAMSNAFAAGLARLRGLAAQAPCAVMCTEVLWWRCHRRVIADYLIAGGEPVAHHAGAMLVYPRSA